VTAPTAPLETAVVSPNTSWAGCLEKGHILRLTAMTIIDFVAFNAADLGERFDQARTKVYNMNIFLAAGDRVLSKLNNHMMTMTEDGFAGLGTHDLQFGMCGRARHQLAEEEGRLGEYLHGSTIALPDHGCAENLARALEPHGISYPDIPSPINLFQNMEIDRATGAMRRTRVRPISPVPVALRAEMDLLVALSACPDLASPTGGQEVRVEILLN
jgi:uncharacterized protein YcgI (DUF1989 family)